MAFYTYEVVNEYARDASRYAMVHGEELLSSRDGHNLLLHRNRRRSPPPRPMSLSKTYLNHQIYPGINGANLTVTTAYAIAPGAGQCTTSPTTTATAPAIRSPLPSLTLTSTTSLSSRGASSP